MNTGSHFEVKQPVAQDSTIIAPPVQARSKATARRFTDAAMRLLRERTFAELSVAELAAAAGRSVGVFYQRFGSKDDFLAILLHAFFAQSIEWRSAMPITGTPRDIYLSYLEKGYLSLVENRNLWHAALQRSASDPDFWLTFGDIRTRINDLTRTTLERAQGRPFSQGERRRLAIAGQVYNSVINNQIINGPGPLELGNDDFFPEVSRIILSIAPFGPDGMVAE
jgi:AcrR family transcriptional regulator